MKKILIVWIITLSFLEINAQTPVFTAHTVDSNFYGPTGIFISDINNDNLKDVVCTAIDGSSIAWWQNNGGIPLVWTKHLISDTFVGAMSCYADDIDGDGNTDVLGASWNGGQLLWWRNESSGDSIIWTKYFVKVSFTLAHEIRSCDLDGDGDTDILGVSAGLDRISWFENDGNWPISWTEHIVVDDFSGARSVYAKDIDGDGDMDLVGAALDDNEIAWWRNEGGSPIQWSKFILDSDFYSAHKVHIADINGDGLVDVLGTSYTGGISWWENNGDTTGWSKKFVSYYNAAVISWAVDLENDNDLDIICSGQNSTGHIGSWFSDGASPINWSYTRVEGDLAETWPLFYGDLDNDGDIDLVCGGKGANEIRWYENDLIANEIVTDFDGNDYNTVLIGSQRWMKENLKSLHYSDGTEINEVWAYNDDEDNVATYGRLYTWDAAMKNETAEGAQGACPDGWHLPTDAEWTELGAFLGGDELAGGKLKESGNSHWIEPNTGATNESGFCALPSGEYDDTHYQFLGEYAVMWSSTETSSTKCKYRYLSYENAELSTYNYYKNFRYSIRCLKNNTVGQIEIESNTKGFVLSPNPAANSFSIHFANNNFVNAQLDIFNIEGKLLLNKSINSEVELVDISTLPVGIYLVKITNNDQIFTERLIKNH